MAEISLNAIEICAGAGGQALGLEAAGFEHLALVELESAACETLKLNRPTWNVHFQDVKHFDGKPYRGVDLLAGGVPCPPFSVAGKQLGPGDERDLFPEVIRLASEIQPRAIMIENVRGLLSSRFADYRWDIIRRLNQLGYSCQWRMIEASDFGVPQSRTRSILIGLKSSRFSELVWPKLSEGIRPRTVGQSLLDLMAENEWSGALEWSKGADSIAPTLVGGSKRHGGPDLGPTRARLAWQKLGVDGSGIGDSAPGKVFEGLPKLTTRMTARIQGFPDDWSFFGKKTAVYRQIGNAFPPPVSRAVGTSLSRFLMS